MISYEEKENVRKTGLATLFCYYHPANKPLKRHVF